MVTSASSGASPASAISFAPAPALRMLSAMDGITLPPELDQFATEAVASGRYGSRDDVVAAGLSLLRQADAEVTGFFGSLDDAQMAAFAASLDAAEAEGERLGFATIEEVMRETDAQLEEMARRRR